MSAFLKKHLLFLCLFLFAYAATAQSSFLSPYQTLSTFQHSLDSGNYRAAATTFPKGTADSEKLVAQLKQILDGKGLKLQMSKVPRAQNYIDSTVQENIYVLFPKVLPEVFLIKNQTTKEWKFSGETAEEIHQLHKEVYPLGTDILVNLIPLSDNYEIFGIKSWQYLGILALIAFSFIFYLLISFVFKKVLERIIRTRFQQFIPNPDLVIRIARLLSLLFIFWIIIRLLPILQFNVTIAAAIIIGVQAMRTVFFTLLGLRATDIVVAYFAKVTARTDNTLDDQILPILKKGLHIIIIIVGVIHILNLMSINVTALIAGISIGGLALALAAQDTVKNLIGSAMIFIDRPFQIGDYIIVSGGEGSVEEVGFRSTRIRTGTNSVTSIPNGMLASMVIDNLGMRIFRRYKTNLTLAYHTTPAQIEAFVEGVKIIIANQPMTRKEGFDVHFHNMGASSLEIMLSVYLEVKTWSEELHAKQGLLLDILKLAKVLGVDFAFPSTSVYMDNLAEKVQTDDSEELKQKMETFFKN